MEAESRKPSRGRKVLLWLLGIVVAVAVAVNLFVGDVATVFTSGSARLLCSAIFAADRDPDLARTQELDSRLSSPGTYLSLGRTSVDMEAETVTASLFGWKKQTAIHREGLGCTAVEGSSVEALRAQTDGLACDVAEPNPNLPWPAGNGDAVPPPADVDAAALDVAVDAFFVDDDPEQPVGTRSVVVVHDGRLIAEQYAEGFDHNTGHLSNSVAKSVTATLIGIHVGDGTLDLADPAPIAEWHEDPEDPKGDITLEMLLRMSSGLSFEESYTKLKSDITMQYVGGDLAGYAAARELEADPGETWHYSTGTAHILGRIVREAASDDLATALEFPCERLFRPLAMHTAVLEPDVMGNFVGGSSVYASTRDYARLGQLYLQDGLWGGERILPEGWVDLVTTHTPGSPPEHPYGGQFWLNWDGMSADTVRYPSLPRDAYMMNGHQGQHVVIIPSLDLVVARNGLSEFDTWDLDTYVGAIVDVLDG